MFNNPVQSVFKQVFKLMFKYGTKISLGQAINDASSLAPGNETIYLKATDNDSGKVVGGIKFVIMAAEDVKTKSPHQAGISEQHSYCHSCQLTDTRE